MVSAKARQQEHLPEVRKPTLIKARWIVPVTSAPLEFGSLEIEGDRIVGVFNAQQTQERLRQSERAFAMRDFGNAIVIPGLINLHTHLDITATESFDNSSGLFDWIDGLIAICKTWAPETFLGSAQEGVRRIIASGTTCVLDSAYTGWSAQAISRAGLRAVVALEIFGLDETAADDAFRAWLQRREKLLDSGISKLVTLAIAPHAPYSVSVPLLQTAVKWAEDEGVAATMHLAESQAELAWLNCGDDRLDLFLEKQHRLPAGAAKRIPFRACGLSPVEHLERNRLVSSQLILAHAVHVADSEMCRLAQAGVKIASCPRSNARLRNGTAPLRKFLENGIAVGFGTDSAASCDNLDVLAEARFAFNLNRAVDPQFPFTAEDALRLLTIESAKALGMGNTIGSLEAGKQADIAIFNIASAGCFAEKHPYDALLYGHVGLKELLVAGVKVGPESLY